jgi:hypothetical protein
MYMNRHTESETEQSGIGGSCQSGVLPAVSSAKKVGPSPGVDERVPSPSPGIPSGDLPLPDLREFVVEAAVRRFVLDERPRTRRAAAAVMLRFAKRHRLQVYRIGRMRMYRVEEFFAALERESRVREERLFRRGLHLG